jgi:hypothetical protein
MLALYIDHAGQKRFEVVRMLADEYRVSFADTKLILAGVRVRLKPGEVSEMYALQEKLEELGAIAVIEPSPDEVEKDDDEDDTPH